MLVKPSKWILGRWLDTTFRHELFKVKRIKYTSIWWKVSVFKIYLYISKIHFYDWIISHSISVGIQQGKNWDMHFPLFHTHTFCRFSTWLSSDFDLFSAWLRVSFSSCISWIEICCSWWSPEDWAEDSMI